VVFGRLLYLLGGEEVAGAAPANPAENVLIVGHCVESLVDV
jgi:hypothetical protein